MILESFDMVMVLYISVQYYTYRCEDVCLGFPSVQSQNRGGRGKQAGIDERKLARLITAGAGC